MLRCSRLTADSEGMPIDWDFLEALSAVEATGFEARLTATAVIVLVAFVLLAVLGPALARASRSAIDREVFGGWLSRLISLVDEQVPLALLRDMTIRAIQLTLLAATGIALVAVWGRVDLALSAFDLIRELIPQFGRIGLTAALILTAYVISGILRQWVIRFAERSSRFSPHQEEVTFRSLQIVLLGFVVFLTLVIWGVDLDGLLIGAGVLGVVVGMAARETLAALVAGLVLMFSRPFEIGDWVLVGNEEGIVTDITIVNTRLENRDGESVVIPNNNVTDSVVKNRTRKGRLRVRIEVGVDYSVDPDWAIEVARKALIEVDDVLRVPAPEVIPLRFDDSAVVLELRAWIDKPSARRHWRARAGMIRAVKAAFEREGVKIPFPQQELSGRAETGGFHLAADAPRIEPGTDGGRPRPARTRRDSDETEVASDESSDAADDLNG